MNPDLYFKQLSLGPMQNFVYLIGSQSKRACVVVDPAWDTDAILSTAAHDHMTIVGSLVTHYHPDHCGGEALGFEVPGGVAEMLASANAPVHAHRLEGDGLIQVTGISESDLIRHDSGDNLEIGDVKITFVHTPGHTPGSQCFFVQDRLVSGDTLFVGGCGRVDLPGGDAQVMFDTLQNRLSQFTDEVVLYPGHDYGDAPSNPLGIERKTNYALTIRSLSDWTRLMH